MDRRALLTGAGALALTGFAKPAPSSAPGVPPPIGSLGVSSRLGASTVVDLTSILSSAQTTGSISAASPLLTVADAANFPVGAQVIIEIGGEAGAGARGTSGVGGQWPALTYATVGAMNADTSKPNTTFAWVSGTGNVYQWLNSAWVQYTDYYTTKATPKALVATILSKAGNVLTLDTAASTTATAANVYLDNAAALNTLISGTINTIYTFPAGTFAISTQLVFTGCSNVSILGVGVASSKLLSPDGSSSAGITLLGCTNSSVHDLHIQGNAKLSKVGFDWATVTQTERPLSHILLGGLDQAGDHNTFFNMKFTDCWYNGIRQGSNGFWSNCSAILTEGLGAYIQWQFDFADTTYARGWDLTATSPYLQMGFEIFRSTYCEFRRCVGTNMVMALNDTGACLVDGFDFTAELNSQLNTQSFNENEVIININANIAADPFVAWGNTLRNIHMTTNYINANNDILRGISVSDYNPNVTIEDSSCTGPDWLAPSTFDGVQGVISFYALNTIVNRFTNVGTPQNYGGSYGFEPNIYAIGPGGTLSYVSAYRIKADSYGYGNTTVISPTA